MYRSCDEASCMLQVGTPSAPLVHGFFMPRGSTVLELRPDTHAGMPLPTAVLPSPMGGPAT